VLTLPTFFQPRGWNPPPRISLRKALLAGGFGDGATRSHGTNHHQNQQHPSSLLDDPGPSYEPVQIQSQPGSFRMAFRIRLLFKVGDPPWGGGRGGRVAGIFFGSCLFSGNFWSPNLWVPRNPPPSPGGGTPDPSLVGPSRTPPGLENKPVPITNDPCQAVRTATKAVVLFRHGFILRIEIPWGHLR